MESSKESHEISEWDKELQIDPQKNRDGLLGYVDADWVSQDHRHSISPCVFQIDGGSISWSCQKQNIVTLSSTEAEFIALTHATKEALWLEHFIKKLYNHLNLLYNSILTISLPSQSHMVTSNMQGPSILTYDSIFYVIL